MVVAVVATAAAVRDCEPSATSPAFAADEPEPIAIALAAEVAAG
jgi:hypothetical protein